MVPAQQSTQVKSVIHGRVRTRRMEVAVDQVACASAALAGHGGADLGSASRTDRAAGGRRLAAIRPWRPPSLTARGRKLRQPTP